MTDDAPRPQHLQALDRANHVRRRRAEITRGLKGGDLSPVDAILGDLDDDANDIIDRMALRDVLTTVRRVGASTAREIVRIVKVPPEIKVGSLSLERRKRVVEVLRGVAPWIDEQRAA